MNQEEIKQFLDAHEPNRFRTMVVVDFGNVIKWQANLHWRIGMRELGILARSFSGRQFLRRFYYGSDYGPNEQSVQLYEWSRAMLEKARMSGFEVITKKVKYIHSRDNIHGFEKKCDLDIEMAVDLIRERDNYDKIILFSGDGDLMYAIRYLKESYQKECFVIGARDHIGREVFDAKMGDIIKDILYAEDFEYRLNMDRFRRS